jgi:hypothetical protein
MKVLNSMKLGVILVVLFIAGCATTEDYALYLDAQKSVSRDQAMMEASRVLALVEMTRSNDPAVKATGLMLLQQLQQGSKIITIEPPKKGILGF